MVRQKHFNKEYRIFKHRTINELKQEGQHISDLISSFKLFSYLSFAQSKVIENKPNNKLREYANIYKHVIRALAELRAEVRELNKRLDIVQESRSQAQKSSNNENTENESMIAPVGNAELICLKGDAAFKGENEEQNYEKAMKFYLEAVEQGSGRACGCLAGMYFEGLGVPKDIQKAVSYYEQGSQYGDSGCSYSLGKIYEDCILPECDREKGIELAEKYYEEAAELKHVQAMLSLAFLHFTQGQLLNSFDHFEKALRWYLDFINLDQNNSDAFLNLGIMHDKGLGTRQDQSSAFNFYNQAVSLGNANACIKCGELMLSGYQDVKANILEALRYYTKSADLGCVEAYNLIGQLYEKGSADMPKNEDLAMKNYERGYQLGCIDAEVNLALMLINSNPERGMQLLEEAAEKGNSRAKEFLRKGSEGGENSNSSPSKNDRVAFKACDQNKIILMEQNEKSEKHERNISNIQEENNRNEICQ